MIHVNRSAVSVPSIFNSAALRTEQERLVRIFTSRAPLSYGQQRHLFKPKFYNNSEIQAALRSLFKDKCAYCESKIDFAAQHIEIEHFRPKSRAMNLNGEVSESHYWWLVYEWMNLYLPCMICNRLKANRFPVNGYRASFDIHYRYAGLAEEEALLLDPCFDYPEEHLVFGANGEVASDTEKGRITIEILALNREQLVVRRLEEGQTLLNIFAKYLGVPISQSWNRYLSKPRLEELKRKVINNSEIISFLKTNLDAASSYTGMRRQFIRQWLHSVGITDLGEILHEDADTIKLITKDEQRNTVKKYKEVRARQEDYSVEVEDERQKEAYYLGAKRIERIEIRNFKAIQKLDLTFPAPQAENESWLMLLGENGTGKSSILQAVGLALMGEQHSNSLGLVASRLVNSRAKSGKGTVKIYLTNLPNPVVLSFNRHSSKFKVEPKDPKVLLLGYGATRLLPRQTGVGESEEKYIRIKNLFSPTAPLNDAERWMGNKRRLSDEKFLMVAEALKDLLMLEDTAQVERRKGEVAIKVLGDYLCLHQLSDGFQSVVALCTDIMISLLERWGDMHLAEGIVLLDEIEVHLHPSWKIEIVQRLRRTFPRVAFLTTTHDPLCLKGLHTGEIVVLRRNERNRIYAMTDVPSVEDLRADQILTSTLFDLRSTRGKTPQIINRYTELLSKRRLTATEKQELEQVREQVENLVGPAGDTVQQLAQQALSNTLMQEADAGPVTIRPERLADLRPDLEFEIKKELTRLLAK